MAVGDPRGPRHRRTAACRHRDHGGRRAHGSPDRTKALPTAYEPNRRLAFSITAGPVLGEIRQLFEAVEGGTRFTDAKDVKLGGAFKLAEPLVAQMILG